MDHLMETWRDGGGQEENSRDQSLSFGFVGVFFPEFDAVALKRPTEGC